MSVTRRICQSREELILCVVSLMRLLRETDAAVERGIAALSSDRWIEHYSMTVYSVIRAHVAGQHAGTSMWLLILVFFFCLTQEMIQAKLWSRVGEPGFWCKRRIG